MTTTLSAEPGAEQRQAAKAPRYLGIELLRILSCIGIIVFHVKAPGAEIGYAGLPALMAISVALAAQRPVVTLRESATKRWARFMWPWLVWSVIYLAVDFVKLAMGKNVFQWYMLGTGTSLHLWYLPAAFAATSLVAVGASRGWVCQTSSRLWVWSAITSLCILTSVCIMKHLPDRAPLVQYVFILPAILAGVAIACIRSESRTVATDAAMVVAAVALPCLIVRATGYGLPVAYLIGLVISAIVWSWHTPAGRAVTYVGGLSYGVYLVHPLAITIVKYAAASNWAIVVLAGTVCSLLISAALKTSRLRQIV